jgi:hypothetical protein
MEPTIFQGRRLVGVDADEAGTGRNKKASRRMYFVV